MSTSPPQAASRAFFEQHVQPELAVVREGRKVLIPTAELERWVAERANRTLP